jgi:hypothetical protein
VGGAQFGTAVAGMAHELGDSGRKPAHESGEFARAESTGDPESREVIREPATVPRKHGTKPRPEQAERPRQRPLPPRRVARNPADGKIERPPHPEDAVLFGKARHGVEHRRQQMRMFVRIEVRGAQARVQDAPYLRRQFLVDGDAAERHRPHQFGDARRQTLSRMRNRFALNQHQVAANIQAGGCVRQPDGIVERRSVGHERGGAENAALEGFHDPGVHVAGESEIVRVDDEPARGSRFSSHSEPARAPAAVQGDRPTAGTLAIKRSKTTLKEPQLDPQKLLRVRADVLNQAVRFARKPVQGIVQLRIDQ